MDHYYTTTTNNRLKYSWETIMEIEIITRTKHWFDQIKRDTKLTKLTLGFKQYNLKLLDQLTLTLGKSVETLLLRLSVQRTCQLLSTVIISLISLIPKIGQKWSQHSPSAKYNKQIWAIKVYFQLNVTYNQDNVPSFSEQPFLSILGVFTPNQIAIFFVR